MHSRSIRSVASRTRSFSATRPISSVSCSTERGSARGAGGVDRPAAGRRCGSRSRSRAGRRSSTATAEISTCAVAPYSPRSTVANSRTEPRWRRLAISTSRSTPGRPSQRSSDSPARLVLGGQLRHLEEGGVGGQITAVSVGDDEAVRRALDQLAAAWLRRPAPARRRLPARQREIRTSRTSARPPGGTARPRPDTSRRRRPASCAAHVVGRPRRRARRRERLRPRAAPSVEQLAQARPGELARPRRRTARAPPDWPRDPQACRRRGSAPPRTTSGTAAGSASRRRAAASSRAPSTAARSTSRCCSADIARRSRPNATMRPLVAELHGSNRAPGRSGRPRA